MSTDAPIGYLVKFFDRAKIRLHFEQKQEVTSTDTGRLIRLAGFSYTTLSLCSSMLDFGYFKDWDLFHKTKIQLWYPKLGVGSCRLRQSRQARDKHSKSSLMSLVG